MEHLGDTITHKSRFKVSFHSIDPGAVLWSEVCGEGWRCGIGKRFTPGFSPSIYFEMDFGGVDVSLSPITFQVSRDTNLGPFGRRQPQIVAAPLAAQLPCGIVCNTPNETVPLTGSLIFIFEISYTSVPREKPAEASELRTPLYETLETSMITGSFGDTRLFAFSRRQQSSGRIGTPKALFVNSSILKAASYYDILLSAGFSESLETALDDCFPASEKPQIDLNDYGYGSDSDLSDYDEAQPSKSDDGVASQQESDWRGASGHGETPPVTQCKLGRTIVVKDAAYRTYKALMFYLYTGEIKFRPLTSSQKRSAGDAVAQEHASRSCSPKSMYRLADKLGLEELKLLARDAIKSGLSEANILEEAFSKFTATPGYGEIRKIELEILCKTCRSASVREDLPKMMRRVTLGELPHASEMVSSFMYSLTG
ncbi:hypothetical protein OE88DRAFT_1654944 [Heliocybe sulcata]|uniref:BTB domain-containing protein n=1 Tax=Heliocybe sulcata TaxID=5364 RepID=A0A5C3NL15_9AGAM|nr:hypothetical protein OE88DRAFT_1654944 [Heliocybe sulcata]